MKINSFVRVGLLSLVFGIVSLSSGFASSSQDKCCSDSKKCCAPPKPMSFLSSSERDQLLKARYQVLATNSSLRHEDEALKDKGHSMWHDKDAKMSDSEQKSMWKSWSSHEDKMRTAMLKVDPTLSKVFAKIDKKRDECKDKCCNSDKKCSKDSSKCSKDSSKCSKDSSSSKS